MQTVPGHDHLLLSDTCCQTPYSTSFSSVAVLHQTCQPPNNRWRLLVMPQPVWSQLKPLEIEYLAFCFMMSNSDRLVWKRGAGGAWLLNCELRLTDCMFYCWESCRWSPSSFSTVVFVCFACACVCVCFAVFFLASKLHQSAPDQWNKYTQKISVNKLQRMCKIKQSAQASSIVSYYKY